jgi:hypothetical protein
MIDHDPTLGNVEGIDWSCHDGVMISMITDILRNRFYDRILSNNVQDRECIDIGFGTGLLSIMAIKHGATNILAFESDAHRWKLGQNIISDLNLGDRIELVCDRFDHRVLDQHPTRLIFTETVNGTLFQEGLINSIPRSSRSGFIPSRYFLHLHCIPVSWNLANGISQPVDDPRPFAPGVDLDPRFIESVNKFYVKNSKEPIKPLPQLDLMPGIHKFPPQIPTVWGWSPHLEIARTISTAYAGYEIDAETATLTQWVGKQKTVSSIDFDMQKISLTLNISEFASGPVIIVPRAGIGHGTDCMMLDDGHWGPMPFPVLCIGNLDVSFTHDLYTGDVAYHESRSH